MFSISQICFFHLALLSKFILFAIYVCLELLLKRATGLTLAVGKLNGFFKLMCF